MKPATQETRTTRDSLIETAMRLFAEQGYEATSTRQIARQAGANIGSISYYFESKEGLRHACAEHIAGQISAMASEALGSKESNSPAEAQDQLQSLVRGFVNLMVQPRSRIFVAFLLREMMQPGDVLEQMFGRLIGPVHRRVCHIWSLATGCQPESEQTRLAVFAMFGQILYFRIAQPIVLKRMNWAQIGVREAEVLTRVLLTNLKASLAAARREQP